MYDQYPIHEVPQNNLIQRFFSQRWSAIVLEIVMTIVITIAAGAAFDFFDPLDGEQATSADSPQIATGAVEIEALKTGDPLGFIKEKGAEHIRDGRFAAAEAMFDWAIALAPEDADSYSWRGYVNMLSGDYVEAQADYRKLLELKPADFDGHNALCWAYGESEQFAVAVTHCERALDAAGSLGEYAIALENRCWLQVELGEYEAAERDCRDVLEAFSDCGEVCALAHFNLGRVLIAQGSFPIALRHFNEAYRIGSTYPKMYLEIGAIYDTLGYRSAAQASYAKYRALSGERGVGLVVG